MDSSVVVHLMTVTMSYNSTLWFNFQW